LFKIPEVTKHPFIGSSLSAIVRTLNESKWSIDIPYVPRLLYAFAISCFALPLRIIERIKYGSLIKKITVENEPIFIIGPWRSGTTFLHKLLSCDPNRATITNFQAFASPVSISGQGIYKSLISLHLPKNRPMDAITISSDDPQEDEFAIGGICGISSYNSLFFPRLIEYNFKRYLTFETAATSEIDLWKKTYHHVIAKATFLANGRQLILKNPPNTARLALLLEMYPKAKFIYIWRDPYETYLSSLRTLISLTEIFTFQKTSEEYPVNYVKSFYPRIIRRFIETVPRIPAGNIVFLTYEALIKNPKSALYKIYDTLNLEGFSTAEPYFDKHIESQRNFKKAKYLIDQKTRHMINTEWAEVNRYHQSLTKE
jgi:hypothetical protein